MSTIHITDENKLQALKFSEQKDVREGLVGEWKLDGNLLDTNDTAVKNNGTLLSGPLEYSTGRVGQAAIFTDSSGYISCGTGVHINGAFAVSLWLNYNGATQEINTVFGKPIYSNNTVEWSVTVYNYRIYCRIGDSVMPTQAMYATPNIAYNTWYHVIFQRDETGLLKIYINNLLVSTDIYVTGVVDNGSTLYIGGKGTSYRFNGSIDEVRIYNRALSPEEITTLYKTQLPKFSAYSEVITEQFDEVITDGLVAYYELNSNTKDSAGGNNGIVGSEAGLGISDITFVDGVKNKCANFPYTNKEYIEAEPVQGLGVNGSDITVCCWVKRMGNHLQMIPIVEQGGVRSFRFVLYGFSPYRLLIGNDGVMNNLQSTYSVDDFVTDEFTHISFTCSDNNYKAYVNGIEKPLYNRTEWYGAWNINKLRIGYRPYSAAVGTWNGLIDDVRIYNRALSPQEIKHIYNSTKPVGA